ncbi:hypothetical protein [Paenibacillus sp. V4I7]|uniref:hypothetical protein n=1 Tax=Paenibacillus sp. V4I7 TaxID=3042307 RepID=UPI002780DB0B|nr:hypothetical protein [Paenibacillus sp. V4I7]MDQ0901252.1 hypothetical protein [Paenibacillus sp. V4I7]
MTRILFEAPVTFEIPALVAYTSSKQFIGNYEAKDDWGLRHLELRPYEAKYSILSERMF